MAWYQPGDKQLHETMFTMFPDAINKLSQSLGHDIIQLSDFRTLYHISNVDVIVRFILNDQVSVLHLHVCEKIFVQQQCILICE